MIKLESAGNKGGEMANIPGIVAKALIMAAGDWPSFFWGGGRIVSRSSHLKMKKKKKKRSRLLAASELPNKHADPVQWQ